MSDADKGRSPVTDADTDADEGAERPDTRTGASSKTDGAAPQRPTAGPSTSEDDDDTCAKAELTTQRVVPKVWLLIDGSGSMAAPLGGLLGPSRWEGLRNALLGSGDALVKGLQSRVEFGLMVYDGGLSPPGVFIEGVCPRVLAVEPALDNFEAIDAAYPAFQTGASTPTHYALVDLSKKIMAARKMGDTTPSYIVLATDGMPNSCDFHDGLPSTQQSEQQAVQTVADLARDGTKTFAISLAGDDPQLNSHLNAIAKAGGTGKGSFTITTQDSLVSALSEILGGATSCAIKVEGNIEAGYECDGDVTLDGHPLDCDDANGYRVLDDRSSIELVGSACDALQKQPSASVSAKFPCEAITYL